MVDVEIDPTTVIIVSLFLNLEGLVGKDKVIAEVKELAENVVVGVRVDHVATVTTVGSHFCVFNNVSLMQFQVALTFGSLIQLRISLDSANVLQKRCFLIRRPPHFDPRG